jgi:pimeloyl-ACP methyl ester carboxylesterase
MTNTAPDSRKIQLASGLTADVLVKGKGAPLIFLHAAHGRTWPVFLDRLAEQFTVYAPLTPGADEPEELMSFDSFSDLALFYDDLMRALKVDRAIVVGHAFGGMVAAEFAAQYPERVSHLVLINAMGMWIDDTPVADIHTITPGKLAELLFTNPEGQVANEVLQPPAPEQAGVFWLNTQLSLGAAMHFYWPIPDRDLKRRLYRITSPTLLVWGASDRVVPPVYANAFAKGIHGANVALIEGAAHFPHLEKAGEVLEVIATFAGASVPETA